MASTTYIKKGEFVAREIAGETIIVPVRGQVGDLESIYNLNEAGTLIWKLIDGQHTVSQIVDAVCEEFDVPRDVAETDTQEFIGQLAEAGMVG